MSWPEVVVFVVLFGSQAVVLVVMIWKDKL